MTDDSDERRASRRAVLTTLAGVTASVAGCGSRSSGPDSASATASPTATATDTQTADTPSLGPATWTTGEKHGVVAAGDGSRGRATLTRGALTEPRFPRVDALQFRRVDYLVTDGDRVWRTHEGPGRADDGVERRVERVTDDALLFAHRFAASEGEWSLDVEYVTHGDALLADVAFDAPDDHALYLVARPALSHGVTGDESGTTDAGLTASDDDSYLRGPDGEPYPVAASVVASGGFEWATPAPADSEAARRLVHRGEAVSEQPTDATGDALLAGRLGHGSLEETVALGFAEGTGQSAATAAAEAALAAGYDAARDAYRGSWQEYLDGVDIPDSVRGDDLLEPQYRVAAMTLRAVESDLVPGAGLAAPCVPWGSGVLAREASDVGYNFVWSRDLYQSFTALEAMGKVDAAQAATEYLLTVQQDDGGFLPQNTFVDGRTRWGGEQLDNVAFPLVMAHQLRERHGLWEEDVNYEFTGLRASANYVARSGPDTAQERWEEEGGLSPSTIAAEVAGLACAAREAEREGHLADAYRWLALADAWRAGVQEWCVTREGAAGHEPPFYYRIAADRDPDDGAERELANGGPTLDERAIVDAGFLELVRLGVLAADDPVVEQSVAVVDEAIRVDTPNGPGWYRYTGDGYGEGVGPGVAEQYDATPDDFGAPWSVAAQGKGRLWPIFTGERGEYELRREGGGSPDDLLRTMARFAHPAGMLPEQVWDREEPSPYGWAFGEGTASATPLSWSMAGFVRLAHGVDAGEPVETPRFVADRYAGGPPDAPDLSVSFPDVTVEQRPAEVTGETDADAVVVHAAEEARQVSVEDGTFAVDVPLPDGRSTITVVAARTADTLLDTGLTVDRKQVSYVGD